MKPPRPCVVHRCRAYAVPGSTRCAEHKRTRWQQGLTGARGSRAGWRKLRLRAFDYRRGICFRCNRPIDKAERWECHHLNHDATDDRLENLAVAHPKCHREEHR